ncbi:MAG: hypothetical protein R2728_04295 [Chitinophagales bacterium]
MFPINAQLMLNHFSKYLILFTAIVIISSCKTDEVTPKNTTIIWQGFNHVWEYNHRVNRLGDWLDDMNSNNGFSATSYHAAASGIGPDKCDYITYLTRVNTSKDIYFESVSREIILSGVEETIDSQLITINLEFPLINNPKAVVLLNGFDMYARPVGSENLIGDGDADKLFNFSILPAAPIITSNSTNTLVSFDVVVTLGGACASPECSSGSNNDFFDYLVTTNYQVILANSELINATSKAVSNQYEWERPRNNNSSNGEIYQSDLIMNNTEIQGEPGYDDAFLGIKAFQFQTEKGFGGFGGQSFEYPHMQSFNVAIRQKNFDSNSGKLLFDADLFFKNWASPVPIFSFGGGGKVNFSLEATAIQIKDSEASVEPIQIIDDIIWFINPLAPSLPNTEASINYHVINGQP